MENLTTLEIDVLKHLTTQLSVDIRSEFYLPEMATYIGTDKEKLQAALRRLAKEKVIKIAALSGYDYCVIELLV